MHNTKYSIKNVMSDDINVSTHKMGRIGQDAHGPFTPYMGLLPSVCVLPL